jgi:hypothetical protein
LTTENSLSSRLPKSGEKELGISGAKGRDKRPAFDALCRDATLRRFRQRKDLLLPGDEKWV